MGEKKSKALERELMDDLLNESSGEKDHDANAGKPLRREATIVQPRATPPVDQAFANASRELENDKTIDLNQPEPPRDRRAPKNPTENANDNATVPMPANERSPNTLISGAPRPSAEDRAPRTSVGRHAAFRQSGAPSSTEAALAQSESLRIAQSRILELEQELERLRIQNEELGAAGETLRRRADELLAQFNKRENDYQNAVTMFAQEKDILNGIKEALQRDLEAARRKNDELELRLSTNIQKIRVRERELENRLELVKMESAALIRSKDELILDVKRQIDQLKMELGNFRDKNQELNRQTNDKHEMLRRTVKTLRTALTMLEGEEEAPKAPQRKAK